MAKQYLNLEQALRNILGLTEIEAKLLPKLIVRARVTVKEADAILKSIGKIKSSSRSYQILASLVERNLLTEEKESVPKTFTAIHPRTLLNYIDEKRDIINNEILELEEVYNTYEPQEKEGALPIKVLNNSNEICNCVYKLLGEGYSITAVLKQSQYMEELLSRMKDVIKLDIKKSEIDTILFENKKLKIFAVLNINTITNPNGSVQFEGNIQPNKELYNYILKKEG